MLEELCDREEIRCLLSKYNVNGDRGRVDLLAQTFAKDGILEFEEQPTQGRDAIFGRLSSSGTPTEATVMRHHLGQCLIEIDGDHATGRTYFALLNEVGLDHHGVYVDTFVRTDEGWRISLRKVRIDWQADHSVFPRMIVRGHKPPQAR